MDVCVVMHAVDEMMVRRVQGENDTRAAWVCNLADMEQQAPSHCALYSVGRTLCGCIASIAVTPRRAHSRFVSCASFIEVCWKRREHSLARAAKSLAFAVARTSTAAGAPPRRRTVSACAKKSRVRSVLGIARKQSYRGSHLLRVAARARARPSREQLDC